MWVADNITMLICFSIHCTNIIITEVFHLLLGFVKIQITFWDFKTQNSVQIRDSDNGGSAILQIIYYTMQNLICSLVCG